MKRLEKASMPGSEDFHNGHYRPKIRRIIIQVTFFLSCLLLGFLIIKQFQATHQSAEQEFVADKSVSELRSEYIILSNKNKALEQKNIQLTEALDQRQQVKDNTRQAEALLQAELEAAYRQAGFLEIRGGGLLITIASTEDSPVRANMLLQLTNELKAAGSSALSINGQRLVAMSEIRDTGNGFSVNGTTFSYERPITMLALGSGVELYNALNMVGGILDRWEEANVVISVKISEAVIIPSLHQDLRDQMFPVIDGASGGVAEPGFSVAP